MDNAQIANELRRLAREMAASGENLYRVQAFRRAGAQISGLNRPVCEIVTELGPHGLLKIPGIGMSLAKTIAELTTASVTNSFG